MYCLIGLAFTVLAVIIVYRRMQAELTSVRTELAAVRRDIEAFDGSSPYAEAVRRVTTKLEAVTRKRLNRILASFEASLRDAAYDVERNVRQAGEIALAAHRLSRIINELEKVVTDLRSTEAKIEETRRLVIHLSEACNAEEIHRLANRLESLIVALDMAAKRIETRFEGYYGGILSQIQDIRRYLLDLKRETRRLCRDERNA